MLLVMLFVKNRLAFVVILRFLPIKFRDATTSALIAKQSDLLFFIFYNNHLCLGKKLCYQNAK